MFGCYRRGDANDPDTYVAAVAMVLARYSTEIIRSVTDPYSGLPGRKNESGWSGLPDVADVKEACEAAAARIERLERYRALPPPVPRLGHAASGRPAANLFVAADNLRYAALVARHEASPASLCRFEKGHVYSGKDGLVRDGIWVPLGWYEDAEYRPRTRPDAPRAEEVLAPIGDLA